MALRRWVGAVCCTVVLLASGCGNPVLGDAAPEAPPYEGPLFVEVTAPPTDQRADRSGAAGQVVDCDAPAVGDSRMGTYDGGSVSRTAARALSAGVGETYLGSTRFREARVETDRVLYTYEVERRIRQAYIVHRGLAVDGRTGWYVESWARCDWAELPELAEKIGLQIWTDGTGRRIPTSELVSGRGPEHCGWQTMTFLNVRGGDLEDGQTYVANPDPTYYPDYFRVPYRTGQRLPSTARDTGYVLDGRRLWVAADRSRAFVGTASSVEVWPATTQPLACA
jgi:hypothetical protein